MGVFCSIEGGQYDELSFNNVAIMRKLSSYADILIPNFTEACFLTDHFYNGDTLSQCESDELIERVRQLGCKSVVITSASVEGKNCVIGYDHTKDEKFKIGFELIDVRFPGTGDIFSAVLASDVLNGECLYTATQHAMETVSNIIIDNLDKNEKFYGVDIERYISEGKL